MSVRYDPTPCPAGVLESVLRVLPGKPGEAGALAKQPGQFLGLLLGFDCDLPQVQSRRPAELFEAQLVQLLQLLVGDLHLRRNHLVEVALDDQLFLQRSGRPLHLRGVVVAPAQRLDLHHLLAEHVRENDLPRRQRRLLVAHAFPARLQRPSELVRRDRAFADAGDNRRRFVDHGKQAAVRLLLATDGFHPFHVDLRFERFVEPSWQNTLLVLITLTTATSMLAISASLAVVLALLTLSTVISAVPLVVSATKSPTVKDLLNEPEPPTQPDSLSRPGR